jgi:hypothetical protein
MNLSPFYKKMSDFLKASYLPSAVFDQQDVQWTKLGCT